MKAEHVALLWAAHVTVDWVLKRTRVVAADSLFSLFGLLSRILFSAITKPFKRSKL